MTTLRRQVKNMVKNYSEAEVKVRDATSNDPWGPSSTLMGEISDLTYNIVALGEVMRMIWKRLNDHGKNWRHVYKSLVLLDYLIKNGNEKVAQQCKEHIVAIQTLKDFQYMEEQKDQGQSVREKAKQLVNLLRDDERLKAERAKAFKARERYAQNAMGISSDNKMVYATGNANLRHLSNSSSNRLNSNYADPYGGASASLNGANSLSPDLEAVRPSDPNEEDLQIKLAIMLSQQEHDEEIQRKRADEAKLQIALEQSKTEGVPNGLVDLSDNLFNDSWPNGNDNSKKGSSTSHTEDLFSAFGTSTNNTKPSTNATSLVDPWSTTSPSTTTNTFDPWKNSNQSPNNSQSTNPWIPTSLASSHSSTNTTNDPWGTSSVKNNKEEDLDFFGSANNSNKQNQLVNNTSSNNGNANDPFGDFFGSTSNSNKASTNPWNLNENKPVINNTKFDPFTNSDLNGSSSSNNSLTNTNGITNGTKSLNPTRKTPESFLGENSSLVNLENLIPARPKSTNPFGSAIPNSNQLSTSSSSGHLNNPFIVQQQSQKGPTINQLQQQSMLNQFGGSGSLPTHTTTPSPILIPSTTAGHLPQPLFATPAPQVNQAPNTMISMPFMSNTTMPTSSSFGISPTPTLFPTLPNLNSANSGFNPTPTNTTPSSSAASTNPFLMM